MQKRMRALRREKPGNADEDLIRRRSLRILSDIYYEQRGNVRLFTLRAGERKKL